MAAGVSSATTADRSWYIAQRWQAYDAELRANLLRIAAVGLFYIVHLWTFFSSARAKLPDASFWQLADAGEVSGKFHLLVTMIAVAWAMLPLEFLSRCSNKSFRAGCRFFRPPATSRC